MTRIRAVLFDAGRTLFAEHPSRAALYAAAAREHGFHALEEAVAAAMSEVHAALPREIDGQFRYTRRWFEVFIQEVFARLGFAGDLDPLARGIFNRFDRPESFRVYPDVRPVLGRMKGASVPLAVVSNWSPRLERLLGRLRLLPWFDTVVSSAVCRVEKPDPAIFRRAAAALGVAPEECLHVGDHPEKDADAANAAGLVGVLLDREGVHPEHADRVGSLLDVLPFVGLPARGL